MARLFVLLIAAIVCEVIKASEAPLDYQNFDSSTNYSVMYDMYAFNLTHFTFYLQDETELYNTTVTISSPKKIGIRFKSEQNKYSSLFENESTKYDISSEGCIINQTILQFFNIFNFQNISEKYFQLTTKSITIKIYFEPFTIEILLFDQTITTINKIHHSLFENTYLKDLFDDTSAISGIDISLDNRKTYFFSGLGGISESFNIDDKIYRLYNMNSDQMHTSIPFIIAHSTEQSQVGFFWANPSDTYIKCSNNSIFFLSEAGFVDLYIFLGTIDDILTQYSLLTGKPYFAPIFSLGYHQCRNYYQSQNEVNMVMRKLEKAKIPFDSIWLGVNHLAHHASFGYNETTFPEPKKLIGNMLANDRYLLRLSNSYLPMNVNHKQFNEALLNGYLVGLNNSIYISSSIAGRTAFPDFLNEAARKWWSTQYNYNVDISNANVFYWNDLNDIILPKDVVHYKGVKNKEIHNIYGLLMSAATSQGLIDRNLQNKEKSHLRPYMVSLDIFSGSQKFVWSWTGNKDSTWEELKKSLSQIVASGISGFPFTGCDVGGFNGSPSDELIIRWFQLAAWTYPFFRQQSSSKSARREPYLYSGDSFAAIMTAITDRYKHILVWYNAARVANLTGFPIIKPLWMFFNYTAKFPLGHSIDDQVILADTFMIAPILNKNQTIRFVVKPPRRWYCYPGGYELQESTSFLVTKMDIPIFLSGGKIILVYQEIGSTAIKTFHKENLDMFIALDEDEKAYGEVYIDDGISYSYLNGSFINIKMSLAKGILTIQHDGQFGSSDDNGAFVQKMKICNIHVFGLKKKPKKNPKYETSFNGNRLLIKMDIEPIYIINSTNLKIINPSIKIMTITTIIIGVLLGLVIIVLSIILPIFLLRREKMKENPQAEDNTAEIKNPILNNESI